MNKWTRFIDSCVGNIARKIQDEFDESKHPRDKGGKFTSKGGEGRGGSNYEHELKQERGRLENLQREAKKHGKGSDIHKRIAKSKASIANLEKLSGEGKEEKLVKTRFGEITPERADALNEAAVALEEAGVPKQKILKMSNEGDLEGMQKLLTGGSKFSSKGGGTKEKSTNKSAKKVNSEASKHIHSALEDDLRQIAEESADKDEFKYNLEAFLEDFVQDDYANTDERAMDNFGYDKETVHAVAEEMKGEIDDIADDFFEEDDDDTSVTGPEDRDYMNEEDDEESDSDPVAKMRKHLDDDLFELASRSESEEEFISKAERRIKQDLWAAKSAPEELPVKGQKAEYALKKILSEIKSGTSEYW